MPGPALQRLVEQIPGRDAAWQTRMLALIEGLEPSLALQALRAQGFLSRWQVVAQAARRLARMGDAEALDLALEWLDTMVPGWIGNEQALAGALVANAVASDTMPVLDALLAHGIAANAGGGKAALRQAIALPNTLMLEKLLELGVRDHGCDEDGLGLLHRVAQGTHAEMARLLVEAGWKVNAQDQTARHQTPLAHAATHGRDLGMFSTLLWLGANAHQPDADGLDVVAKLKAMSGEDTGFAAQAMAEIERIELELGTARAQGEDRRAERL